MFFKFIKEIWCGRNEIFRFFVVGLTATFVHYSVALYLIKAQFSPYISNFFAFLVAVNVSYFGHFCWTFRLGLNGYACRLPKFLVVSITGVFVTQGVLYFLHDVLHLSSSVALAGAVLAIPPGTYVVAKFWVFRT